YQESCLRPQLQRFGPVRSLPYRSYFNVERIAWRYRPWNGEYRIGRISRDSADKFALDSWRIFDRVLVPPALLKKVYVLGYGPNAARKCGAPPPTLDWLTWSPGVISSDQFFRTIDTMIHKTGGSRESLCRVLLEAYAAGV